MSATKGMTETELASLCDGQISDAVAYDGSELSAHRENALQYYNGNLPDIPTQVGKSSVTSHDLSDTIGWLLPALSRVFLASDQVAIFEPQKPQDEPFAKQATDLVNHIFLRECDGYSVLRSGIHDGLQFGNGIVKHWWDAAPEYETLDYSGLSDDAFQALVLDDNVEVLEHSAEGEEPMLTHSVRIKRRISAGRLMVRGVAGEDFGLERAATALNERDCNFCFHRDTATRSELKLRGYDKALVDELPAYVDRAVGQGERDAREPLGLLGKSYVQDADLAAERVEVYECYVKCDYDGDGVAEWRQVVMGGLTGDRKLLANEEWAGDLPFTDLVPDPVPHRWRGRSIFDEVVDVQRVKTVLLRKMLDSLYNAVEPIRVVNRVGIDNIAVAMDPKAGDTIITTGDPTQAVRELAMPFVGKEVGPVIEYMDQVAERRTGVGNQSAGLDMDALQNQTATATNAQQAASYGKKEDYARNLAEVGLRRLFRCLLRLVIAHQDMPRTIRLRGEWVQMDPRLWNADMDVTINTGLGSGSRDRDLQMLIGIKGSQEQILMQMGPQNPLVGLPEYRNTLAKLVEVSGMRSPELYFKEITPEIMAQFAAASQGKPDPKTMEAQAKLQIEQQKAQADAMLAQQRAQADIMVQREQGQLKVQLAREEAAAKLDLARQEAAERAQLMRDEAALKAQLRREEMMLEAELTAEANRMRAEQVTSVPVDTNIERPT